ncbi:hypothetical protein CDD82_1294 [Ophiocordyceps australis]|uniref:Uncharacterized protein n=1 Tax=Ophiocordyceps australis TaxID=1399860 RepID=A0A2C5YKQ1_9HYPO|nr:hypothetical protein CDD82_1294 [Ophiocordyceps australis]
MYLRETALRESVYPRERECIVFFGHGLECLPVAAQRSTSANTKQGDGLSPQTPVVFQYTRNFEAGQSLVVTDQLFACEADSPPAARTDDLVHVCTLTTDLSAVPRRLFTRQVSTQGVEFDNLDFSLEMTVGSAGLGFELKVDGQRYGHVEADFH